MTMTVITISRRRLAYVSRRRGEDKWLRSPNRLERIIVRVVNRLLCFVFGHDTILRGIPDCMDRDGKYPCTACSARFK